MSGIAPELYYGTADYYHLHETIQDPLSCVRSSVVLHVLDKIP